MTRKVFRLSELYSQERNKDIPGGALCFGHFNAIHPGHLRHFQSASEYKKPLVVAIEGDANLLEIEQAEYFSEAERAESVAALNLVDYVVILDEGGLEDLVRFVDFQFLVLGKEYESARASKVKDAVAIASKKNLKVIYDAGETHYSGSQLLSGSLNQLEQENWNQFVQAQEAQGIDLSSILSEMRCGTPPKILVLGDTIVDRYVACDPVGMSHEAPVIVVKEMETRDYVGGAGIVSAHVSALGADCTYLSVTGLDDRAELVKGYLGKMGVDSHLYSDKSRPTTFKIRYMVENQKLFRVSRLKEHSLPREIEDKLIRQIERKAETLDGILISDFVYGVVTPRIIKAVKDVSTMYGIPLFGDLQCSSQVGSILKFENFALISPTEREARIALGNHDDGVEYIAHLLIDRTKSKNLVLKLGGAGFIAYVTHEKTQQVQHRQHFPALTANPIDVTGAGDALIAALTVCLTKGFSLMQAASFATCVSAIAVQTLGNHPITLAEVCRFYSKRGDKRSTHAV